MRQCHSSSNNKAFSCLEFDYVIVGAGPSAVGLLLGLLEPYRSSDNSCPYSIAIIERGPFVTSKSSTTSCSRKMIQQCPSRWFEASHRPDSEYVSILQTFTTEHRRVDVPVGRGVGGGSNINACLCIAPPMEDFANWPAPWMESMAKAVPFLQRRLAENQCLVDAATGNPLLTAAAITSSSNSHAVPCLAKMIPKPHSNHSPLGTTTTLEEATRVNYYEGLVEPLLKDCPHLEQHIHWFCDRQAQRLVLEGNIVRGVEVQQHPQDSASCYQSIMARQQVLLCAGALETPALLLVSGIGGDGPKTSVSGVGKQMRDHIILPRVFLRPPSNKSSVNGIHKLTPFSLPSNHTTTTTTTTTRHNTFLLLTTATEPTIALHFFTRILETSVFAMVPRCSTITRFTWRILEALIHILVLYTPVYYLMKYGLTTMNLSLVNPQSTGRLDIVVPTSCSFSPGDGHGNSNDSDDKIPLRRKDVTIAIDAGYLTDARDIRALREGWTASPVVCPEPFQFLEIFPGICLRKFYQWYYRLVSSDTRSTATITTKIWFVPFARHMCLPFFHWCGTCAMKTNDSKLKGAIDDKEEEEWVVDSSLRVRSYLNLRVCDASVFPNNLSVPPALACAALGYILGSEILAKDNPKRSSTTLSVR